MNKKILTQDQYYLSCADSALALPIMYITASEYNIGYDCLWEMAFAINDSDCLSLVFNYTIFLIQCQYFLDIFHVKMF